MPILFGLLKVQWCSCNERIFKDLTTWIYVYLLNYGSVSNWMNLRDADNGKILWQGNEDL